MRYFAHTHVLQQIKGVVIVSNVTCCSILFSKMLKGSWQYETGVTLTSSEEK